MQDIDENPAFYFRFMGILDNLFIRSAVLHRHQGYFPGYRMEPDLHFFDSYKLYLFTSSFTMPVYLLYATIFTSY